MALTLSIQNLVYFLSYITPFLIGFLIITIGFANNEVGKSLMYIAGATIVTLIGLVLRLTFFSNGDGVERSPLCGPFELFANIGSNTPALSVMFMTYSFIYMLLPMIANNVVNIPFLVLMIGLLMVGIIPKLYLKCTNLTNTIISALSGTIAGGMYYLFLSNYKDLLFFSGIRSNKTYCSKPDKTNFKCSVYKNGQLIQQI